MSAVTTGTSQKNRIFGSENQRSAICGMESGVHRLTTAMKPSTARSSNFACAGLRWLRPLLLKELCARGVDREQRECGERYGDAAMEYKSVHGSGRGYFGHAPTLPYADREALDFRVFRLMRGRTFRASARASRSRPS